MLSGAAQGTAPPCDLAHSVREEARAPRGALHLRGASRVKKVQVLLGPQAEIKKRIE